MCVSPSTFLLHVHPFHIPSAQSEISTEWCLKTHRGIKLHTAQLTEITAEEEAVQHPYSKDLSLIETNEPQAQWLSVFALRSRFSLTSPANRHSANQLLLYLRPRGEGGLAEGEGVTARLELTLARAQEVRPDQVQLRGRNRALGLRLRVARLWLIQRGGRPSVEVRVGVGMGEGVQPGVVEAFFCRGSLPVQTNTITVRMSGNSRRVYITGGLPGSSDSLNAFSRRCRPFYFSTSGLKKEKRFSPLRSLTDDQNTQESSAFSDNNSDLTHLDGVDWTLWFWKGLFIHKFC